jgi:hypothetical protein
LAALLQDAVGTPAEWLEGGFGIAPEFLHPPGQRTGGVVPAPCQVEFGLDQPGLDSKHAVDLPGFEGMLWPAVDA